MLKNGDKITFRRADNSVGSGIIKSVLAVQVTVHNEYGHHEFVMNKDVIKGVINE